MTAKRTRSRALAVLTGVLIALSMSVPAASAHAKLLQSSPADGASVSTHLRAITLAFDDVVQLVPRSLVVVGANGAPLTTSPPRLLTSRIVQANLPDRLAPGSYHVAWRILADDGHIESGTFVFSAVPGAARGDAGTTAPAPPAPAQPVWPVIVAAGLAAAAIGGAALVVRRGMQAVRIADVAEPYPVAERTVSPPEHAASHR